MASLMQVVAKCNDCGKSFGRLSTLKRHVSTIHSTDVNLVVCEYCKKEMRETSMRKHKKICKELSSSRHLERHLITVHKIEEAKNENGNNFMIFNTSFMSINENVENSWTNTYLDSIYDDLFLEENNNKPRYKCFKEVFQGKGSYSTESNLKKHMLKFHDIVLTRKCDTCDDFFASKHALNRHIKKKHLKQKRNKKVRIGELSKRSVYRRVEGIRDTLDSLSNSVKQKVVQDVIKNNQDIVDDYLKKESLTEEECIAHKMSLGSLSEQVVEASHSKWIKLWESSYKIRNLDSELYGERLLSCLLSFNSRNI